MIMWFSLEQTEQIVVPSIKMKMTEKSRLHIEIYVLETM